MEPPTYDSTKDTLLHIKRVSELLIISCHELMERAMYHDESKLEPPEKDILDKNPFDSKAEYGSDEYEERLKMIDDFLEHHYDNNRHHPEFHENGVDDMNLFDILEMLVDWKAATERHEYDDIRKSLKINRERFGLSDQLVMIMENTIEWLNLS